MYIFLFHPKQSNNATGTQGFKGSESEWEDPSKEERGKGIE